MGGCHPWLSLLSSKCRATRTVRSSILLCIFSHTGRVSVSTISSFLVDTSSSPSATASPPLSFLASRSPSAFCMGAMYSLESDPVGLTVRSLCLLAVMGSPASENPAALYIHYWSVFPWVQSWRAIHRVLLVPPTTAFLPSLRVRYKNLGGPTEG